MQPQDDIKILKLLAKEIDEYFMVSYLNKETRSTDIYDFIKKRTSLRDKFSTGIAFNQFLRHCHKEGIFKAYISNCTVDDSNPKLIQWKFYRKSISSKSKSEINADSAVSTFNYFKGEKIIPTNTDQLVRSLQEQYIFNRLLSEKHIKVYYERKLTSKTGVRYPDFTIENSRTSIIYFWEHFGMTDNADYDKKLPERIEWYSNLGIEKFDNGGQFISTVYSGEAEFQNEVERILVKLKNGIRK